MTHLLLLLATLHLAHSCAPPPPPPTPPPSSTSGGPPTSLPPEGTTSSTTSNSTGVGCRCGVRAPTSRILGGGDAQENAYPWMAALTSSPSGGSEFECGAAVVAREWVATAAHCFYSDGGTQNINGPNDLSIIVGAHRRKEGTETSDIRKVMAVESFYIHESYSSVGADTSDIALVRLASPLDSSLYPPVCLPPPDTDYTGARATIIGWGLINNQGQEANTLQELEVTVVSDSTCKQKLELSSSMMSTILCAGGEQGKDACSGDSGAPLMVEEGGAYTVVGLNSFGEEPCGQSGYPGAYTEVSALRAWMEATMAAHGGATTCPQ